MPISALAARPAVRFRWGTFRFDGRITALEQELDLFSPDGRPLRAALRVRPGERGRGAGALAGSLVGRPAVPDLLGQHQAVVGGAGHGGEVAVRAPAREQLVLASLSGQQGPGTAQGLVVGGREDVPVAAVARLAVAVEGEAVPDGAVGGVRAQRPARGRSCRRSRARRRGAGSCRRARRSSRRSGCRPCSTAGSRASMSRARCRRPAPRRPSAIRPPSPRRRRRRRCPRCAGRRRPRRPGPRSRSRSCWARSRPGSPSAPAASAARWRRGSRPRA
jgi:hypothetical protein